MTHPPPKPKNGKQAETESREVNPHTAGVNPRSTGASPQSTGVNLEGEIRMLRAAMQRVFELGQAEQDPDFTLKVLRTLSIATGRLAVLLKSQQQIAGTQEDKARVVISQALRDLIDEWGLK